MYMDSPISSNEKRSGLRQSARVQTPELKPENIENGSTTATYTAPANVDSENGNTPVNHDENVSPKSGSDEKSTRKRKKVSTEVEGIRYPLRSSLGEKVEGEGYHLRSSLGNSRVIRSMPKMNCETEPELDTPAANPVIGGRKKRRVNGASNDEFSLTRKRVRYLLNQMKYEQTLIDAYTGEGWKGQSAEKIRPKKELERAKSKILHCKFRIRELFQHLDSSSSEGRFDESLFDSEGRIDSEDIFCAKCRSKDLAVDNDIILCDGLCNRGFHQKCLNPPLLTKDIPLGDEGWLCPACECKIDCIKLLNEFQGSTISIKDTWEKFFPEAVGITNGDKSYDDLPSDDSEDSDYEPDSRKGHKEGSDSKKSAKDSDASNNNKQTENFGLPSDDSEDDDFNLDAPDNDKSDDSKDGSSSDESDFTSDSDEFCNELTKNFGAREDTASSLRNLRSTVQSGEGSYGGDESNSELLYKTEPGLNQDENVLVSGKRHHERLDYKKLHDETYGKSSSESSDDEDWSESSGMSTPSIRKKYATRKKINGPSKANFQIGEKNGYYQEPDSNRNKPSVYRRLDEIATQKLHQSFQEDQYPPREKKESLAQELGLTYQKVDKWFVNTRHCIHASSEKTQTIRTPAPRKVGTLMKESITPNIETTSWSNKPEENFANHVSITPNTETASWSSKPDDYLAQYFSSTPNTETTSWSTEPIENFAHFVSNAPNIEITSWINKPAENFGHHIESEPSTRKKSVKPRKTKDGAEQGMNTNGMDKERQKAVARELRKMKLGR